MTMVLDLSFIDRPAGMDPTLLGTRPFLLRPGNFSVIDGDTIWVLPNPRTRRADGGPPNSFSIRFRSIAAPERPKKRATDAILKAGGVNPYWDSAGQKATDLLKTYLDKRALLVQPSGEIDRHGRMLGDMYVVPYTGARPDLDRAISIEHLMLDNDVVSPFRQEARPPLRPQLLDPEGP
jgi:hypothetical protein